MARKLDFGRLKARELGERSWRAEQHAHTPTAPFHIRDLPRRLRLLSARLEEPTATKPYYRVFSGQRFLAAGKTAERAVKHAESARDQAEFSKLLATLYRDKSRP